MILVKYLKGHGMVTIGRRGIRSLQTPSNSGMSRRADNRLDAIVDAQASKFKTALAVDGSVAFIFNKHKGITACTCRGYQNLNGIPRHETRSAGHETPRGDVAEHTSEHRSAAVFQSPKGVRQVDGLIKPENLDTYLDMQNYAFNLTSKIEDLTDVSGFVDDPNVDVLDALADGSEVPIYSGDGDPMRDLIASTNLGNSSELALSPSMVACPICFGAGFIDSWRLYNGERILLDASQRYDIEITNDVELDDSLQPVAYSIYERSTLTWKNVAFPTSWRHLLRLAVFNKGKRLPTDSYKLYFEHSSAPGVRNELTTATLKALNNGNLLRQDNKLTIHIESSLGSDFPLIITHAEIMLHLGEIVRIQMPEVIVPNEDEFVDWNLNLSAEMSPDVNIKENSYLVDGKYKRVWKVSSVNRKMSARGKSIGYSVDMRAIHSFERQWMLMNVLASKPIDPFNTTQLRTYDDED